MPWIPFTFCFVLLCVGAEAERCERRPPLAEGCCDPRIVGGVATDISEVPYQAALLWGDYYFCGAAIIGKKFLVTGAHCILFFFQLSGSGTGLSVRVGSSYSGKEGVLLRPVNTTCHPKFDFDNYDYDICVIEIDEPIQFSKKVRPIKIGDVEPKGGEVGKVAGWGTLWEGGKLPEKLMSVMVPVTNQSYCQEAYEKVCPVSPRMFCAGEEGKDSCQGDSGGALAVEGLLLGVISTGFGCGLKNFPGVYTSVAHPEIRKFIKNVANI